MSPDLSNHPAFIDPQGWSAAAQIMQAAGQDQCSAARHRLDASISRARALVRALCLVVNDSATPNMQDVCEMIDMVRDTVEGMGEDPLEFVEGFEHGVKSAIYQNLTARPASQEAAMNPPADVSSQSFADVLRTAIEGALSEVPETLAKPAKALKATKRKASVKGAA